MAKHASPCHFSPMTHDIRQLIPDDFDNWQSLWAQYNAFYGRTGQTALPEEVIATTWSRLLAPQDPVFGLVATDGPTLLGLAHVIFHRNLIQTSDTCYLQDLFTAPEARGKGIARALISGVQDLCKTRNVRDIYWHTQRGNTAARRLYDALAQDTDFTVYRMPVAPDL